MERWSLREPLRLVFTNQLLRFAGLQGGLIGLEGRNVRARTEPEAGGGLVFPGQARQPTVSIGHAGACDPVREW